MDLDLLLGIVGPAAIEGVIFGVILGIIWSMASKLLQWFLIGEFLLLKWLESRQILIVDWEKLTGGLIENGSNFANEAITILESIIDFGMFGLSATIGFWLVRKVRA